MTHNAWRRAAVVLIFLAVTLGIALGVWAIGYRQALGSLRERGESDLALTVDRLTGQLQRYQDLAVLMATHPELTRLDTRAARQRAGQLLLGAADRTTALNLIYLSPEGEVLAQAHPIALTEQALARFRTGPIFQRALNGALGTGIGLYSPEGVRSYVFAAPNYAVGQGVRGVLVVAVDMDHVERAWLGQRPVVYFTDAQGRVFATSRSELVAWREVTGEYVRPEGTRVAIDRARVGAHDIWRADLGDYIPNPALRLTRDLPQIGMRATALIDETTAARLAILQAAVAALVMLSFGAVIYWATERRRVLARANAQLETRVAARTAELSGANMMLRREVTERQEAEAALKRAQAELVQAGKLSALGQMSAGLSHELNQPLMAIRQFAENGTLLLSRGKAKQAAGNLSRIEELAGRMGRIIRNLRAFARQESEPARRVDLVQVIEAALEMTEARLAKDAITLDWQPPAAAVPAMAGDVRLTQVMVNLITNAADAMSGRAERRLAITLTAAPRPTIRVADTGSGIAQPEHIFDPFYSTKEVGASEGMGLGLSISYGMVQSFGGTIRGRNRSGCGAVFTVELRPVAKDLAAE